MKFRRCLIAASLSISLAGPAAPALAEVIKGPSSSATPYVVNVPASVDIISLLTVGDSVNDKPGSAVPYRMVGIPDGLGAHDNHDGTFTVLMNHELGAANGAVRRHGFAGAFVSQWIVRKSDLAVLHGGDLAKQVLEWNAVSGSFQAATRAIGRLCSADLPAGSAFYNRHTGKGYTGRIFMDGEEVGNEGRAFAHIVTGPGAGISYELPSLGKFSWENSLASPFEQDKTVVIGLDDSTPGQLYIYVGQKQASGDEIEKAGLHGGWLYGVKVQGFAQEDVAVSSARGPGIASGTPFALHLFGDVRATSGAQLQADSAAAGVTEFLRPEDGGWDTRNPNVFYFVTTDRFDGTKDGSSTQVGRSRVYRLTFHDIRDPELGGRIDMMLEGTGPQQMLDNMTVDGDGDLILQEDPGNQAHLARIWKFNPRNRALTELARHDPARFSAPTPPFTRDEESSGVIEITHLLRKPPLNDGDEGDADSSAPWVRGGTRYYLGVVQAHYNIGDAELAEGGQLFIMAVPRSLR